jgi:CheY-like chemotaxis protein
MDILRTIRLLVVEDNPAYLYLIQRAFAGRGEEIHWELTTATDGEQAMQILFEEEKDAAPLPDLVLLDWNLPKVSGSEILRRVKQHPKPRRIPILIFSSSASDDDVRSAYDDHANGFIAKPENIDALESIVETIERCWIAVARIPKVVR